MAEPEADGGGSSKTVRKRHVLHFGGFEPVAPDLLDRRMESGIERFPRVWNAEARKSAPHLADDGLAMSWSVEASGPNWATETRFTTLRWDASIEPYVRGPRLLRMLFGYAALLGFAANGTIARYFRIARRYGYFSIFPFVVLIVFALIAWFLAGVAMVLGLPYPGVTAPLLGIAILAGLLHWGGHAVYLDFSLDHWKFAEDFAKRRVQGLDGQLDALAGKILAVVSAGGDDEVVVSGTSLGAVMAVEALARVMSLDPEAFRRGRRVVLLTTGSSLLQVGLHPAAVLHRAAVAKVAAQASPFWLEIQTTTDPVNFCDTDPVAEMGIVAPGRPVVRVFRLRELMNEEAYRRIRYNHIRLHRHYVMPNGRRHFYDFYMICFGPMSLQRRVALGERAPAAFAIDGSYGNLDQATMAPLASRPGIG